MSVLFGNPISSFVAIGQLRSGSTYIADEDLQAIAANFRHNPRLDALKLIYLGVSRLLNLVLFDWLTVRDIFRAWHVFRSIPVHLALVLYQRSYFEASSCAILSSSHPSRLLVL